MLAGPGLSGYLFNSNFWPLDEYFKAKIIAYNTLRMFSGFGVFALVEFFLQSWFLTNWLEVFCACGNQNLQPRFLKNLSLSLYVCKLINHAIYWTKYEEDFILYPLCERERSPNKLALWRFVQMMSYNLLHNSTNENPATSKTNFGYRPLTGRASAASVLQGQ